MAATSKNGTAARTRSVGTKLTEEEYARLESLAAAAGQSVSEWARTALLATTTPTPINPNENSMTRQVGRNPGVAGYRFEIHIRQGWEPVDADRCARRGADHGLLR